MLRSGFNISSIPSAQEAADLELTIAAQQGDAERFSFLLKRHGANINYRDENGSSPLMHAIENGHAELARQIIEQGANLDIRDRNGRLPMELAVIHDLPRLITVMLENGAKINGPDQKSSNALIRAVMVRKPAMVRQLLDHGADVNVQDTLGRSPLHWAVMENNPEITLMLVRHGANESIRSNDSGNPTVLEWAESHGNCHTADILRAALQQRRDNRLKWLSLKVRHRHIAP